jgi:hypothetical protein
MSRLPEGVSEIYLHPATGSYPGSTPGYRYAQELMALTSPEAREAAQPMRLGAFRDFAPG